MDHIETAQAVTAAEHLLAVEQAIEVAAGHPFVPAAVTAGLRSIFSLFHMLHGDVQQLKAQAAPAPIAAAPASSSSDQAAQGNPAA